MTVNGAVRRFPILCTVLLAGFNLGSAQTAATPAKVPYLDPSLPIETRLADILSRLTLEEKISLLGETQPAIPRLDIRRYHFGNEALHGVVRPGKFTVFPMSIGLASTWDPALLKEMASAISDEARARYNVDRGEMESIPLPKGLYNGLLTFWSPTINMARDPRWGRTGETYGEDPFLTSRLAVQYIHGLQGDDPRYLKVVSTPKHFAAHNQERERFKAESNASQSTLYEYYLPAFRAAITEGNAESIMTSYNMINGVPSTANHWLLSDVLRDQWHFKGFVVTDCGAVGNLYKAFTVAKDAEEASAMAINAGVDMECGTNMQRNLGKAHADGLVTTAAIDRAVANLLRGRFRLGMFDPQEMVPYSKIGPDVIGSAAHERIALKTAQESMVLLKNAPFHGRPLLPLRRLVIHSIALLGPYAGIAQIGDYSGEPIHGPVTPLEGIQAAIQNPKAIHYVPYVKTDPKQPIPIATRFAAEVAAARMSDVAVVFVGFGTDIAREGEDRTSLDLAADQQELVRQVVSANPRTVVVLISGGPLAISWIKDHVPAILEAWYPGEQGGTAIADVLLGKVSPAGRLPLTFYRSTDQLPPMSDYEISHGRTYRYFTGDPLFAFGHGLSYTKFAYSNLAVSKSSGLDASAIHVTVDVSNRGDMDGDEVVQLYFHEENGLAARPIRQLGAFARVFIAKGKTMTVKLEVPYTELKVYIEQ